MSDSNTPAIASPIPWRSTETELVCSAAGGPFGGRVKIEIEGADDLIQYTGPTLPFEQSLAAGEDIFFKIHYRAAKESGAADDIKVTATFTENETEWEQVSRDTATAIRLEFKPEVRAPENTAVRTYLTRRASPRRFRASIRLVCLLMTRTADGQTVASSWQRLSAGTKRIRRGRICHSKCSRRMSGLSLTFRRTGCLAWRNSATRSFVMSAERFS